MINQDEAKVVLKNQTEKKIRQIIVNNQGKTKIKLKNQAETKK